MRLREVLMVGDFLDWVLVHEKANYSDVVATAWRNPYPPSRKRQKSRGYGAAMDTTFKWVLDLDPAMSEWRLLAAEYLLETAPRSLRKPCYFVSEFLEHYILRLDQPRQPLAFLNVSYQAPPLQGKFVTNGCQVILVDFMSWIIRKGHSLLSASSQSANCQLRNPFAHAKPGFGRACDPTFLWLSEVHPQLEEWRVLAEKYLLTLPAIGNRLSHLNALFVRLIVPNRRNWDPREFFQRGNSSPAPEEWITRVSNYYRSQIIRCTSTFFDWILGGRLSIEDKKGEVSISVDLVNPFADLIDEIVEVRSESNKAVLPYRYIDECRRILRQGTTLREWKFAQCIRHVKKNGGDWFEVPYEAIDEADPDCVWSTYKVGPYDETRSPKWKKRQAYFMWCPARAIALYVKLLLPLRTYQVRVLDSGEADTFRFSYVKDKKWTLNASALAGGSEKRPIRRGVFRRHITSEAEEMTCLYINTNKTADIGKEGDSRGYVIPWEYDEALYWLSKLRDWQEKYNPIEKPTAWASLDHRHVGIKTLRELLTLGEACFLFRDAVGVGDDRLKPLRKGQINVLWDRVCVELEQRLYAQGTLLPNGEQIRFTKSIKSQKPRISDYPLHSLRVTLLTLFALEGGVPLVYLSKLLAGHARLLMTIYYIKPGIAEMTETMNEAMNRMGNSQMESEARWLVDAAQADLERATVANSPAGIDAIIGGRPGAGWIVGAKGVCPVGGARCEDGGPIRYGTDRKDKRVIHGPVSGGPSNCVRCRFFITGPAFLPGLVAHQNLLSFRFGELGTRYQQIDERIGKLKDKRERTGTGLSEADQRDLRRLEVEDERIQMEIDQVGQDMNATHLLIKKSMSILNGRQGEDPRATEDESSVLLVSSGKEEDVRVSFEEVGELHQLSVLCENAIVYLESADDAVVYRRSQLIDAALELRKLSPFLCRLSRDEQLRAGNHMMRFLSAHSGSLRNAVGIIEGSDLLSNIGLLADAVRASSTLTIFDASASIAIESKREHLQLVGSAKN
jgi:hypothetical protein